MNYKYYLGLVALILMSCQQQDEQINAREQESVEKPVVSTSSTLDRRSDPLFIEQAELAGLKFQHYSGARGQFQMPEILGSGIVLIDYDNDGDQDVYAIQGADISDQGELLFPLPKEQAVGHQLFANQLVPTGELSFVNATKAANLEDSFYGMGAAVSDYDNDGDLDLYVLGYQDNAFYKNNGGIFERVSDAAGAQDNRWGSSASFCDVNGDQWPDLYVANYIFYSPTQKVICRDTLGQEDYCSPDSYDGAGDSLFINQKDGTFKQADQSWNVATEASTGLGVLCRDLNLDGWQDIYVANDSQPNILWVNQEGSGFVNEAGIQGAAINMNGQTEGSMGVTAGDFDSDGDDDLFMTHWNNETNTIYRNDAEVGFLDVTSSVNLSAPSLSHTGFGTDWFDYDNDGDLDIFIANGAVQRYVDKSGQLSKNYGQKNQLLRNDSGRRFTDVTARLNTGEQPLQTGRGAAFGDVDNDGDVDVVVSNKDGPIQLYLNQTGQDAHWLGLHLRGTNSNRDAQGAIVEVEQLATDASADNSVDTNALKNRTRVSLRRVVRYDGSYQSAHDPRVLIGLADSKAAVSIVVTWPNGERQRFENLATDQYHVLVER